ncbi:MAG: hypothetical protein JJT76_11195 [Clostridiaceae bacterium]|nr:hypothetical protein [Clostridiaceae bacterium]
MRFMYGYIAILIFFHLFLSTGRKLMIPIAYEFPITFITPIVFGMLDLFIWLGPPGRELFILFGILFLCLLLVARELRGRYILYNLDSQMISDVLASILEKMGIRYEHKGKTFILQDFNKSISYEESSDAIKVDLQKIRDLPFYKEIITELNLRIRELESTIRPMSLVLHIGFMVLGIFLIWYFKG